MRGAADHRFHGRPGFAEVRDAMDEIDVREREWVGALGYVADMRVYTVAMEAMEG
jgi:hypothetical protein